MADFFTDLTTLTLNKGLDAAGLRHRAIADNIANVETPGYKRSEVSFQEELRQAMRSSDTQSQMSRVEELQPKTNLDVSSPAGPNGNNVSMDREMAELTKSTIDYESYVRLLNLKFSMLTTAITEGKR